MQMIELAKANAGANLRIDNLPFERIPGQSKLFLQYQSNPLSLRKFYPSAVSDYTRIADRIPEVLENYLTDRSTLCDILVDQNRQFGGGEKAFENIEWLRSNDAVAVVTGQQAGLFSGPLYTIYKAMSAIRMAEYLTSQGHKAVPLFWVATEDHDFDEVASTDVIAGDGGLRKIVTEVRPNPEGLPVGNVKMDASIGKTIDSLFDELATTEFTAPARQLIGDSYREGESFGSSFAGLISRIFAAYGLIVLDPFDERIKRLASPIYSKAVERADEIVEALLARNSELADAGFHSQVLVEDDYYPLFWHDNDGVRRALKRDAETLRIISTRDELRRSAVESTAADDPSRLSPGVMLRPVVQDYLLPTVCYFGGAAEIAYFAQNSEVYRILERPVTPILHRQSFTIIEPKHQRTLERFGLTFEQMFAGIEELLPKIVDEYLDPHTSKTIVEVEENINTDLNRLDGEFTKIDPTLAANLATRRRKILYHIGALYKKFQKAQIRKDEVADRQIKTAFTALLPHGALQERSINLLSFLDRHGFYFVDWLYDGIDLSDKGHRVIYL